MPDAREAPDHVRTPSLIALGAANCGGTEMQLECNAPGSRLIQGTETTYRPTRISH